MTDDVQKTEQANMTNNLMRTEKAKQADKEWDDLKRELETLGDQVKSLRDHAGALGETNELMTVKFKTAVVSLRERIDGLSIAYNQLARRLHPACQRHSPMPG